MNKGDETTHSEISLIHQGLPELNSLENVLIAQSIISARISASVMDPMEGKIIMQSLDMLRNGFAKQAEMFQAETNELSQAKKDAIDDEFNSLLLQICNELQELKRNKKN